MNTSTIAHLLFLECTLSIWVSKRGSFDMGCMLSSSCDGARDEVNFELPLAKEFN